jgi:rubrerythrin
MLVDEVLSRIGAVESSLAGLYRWYSEVLAADVEAASVFSVMSEEENKHAGLVEYSRQLARSDAAYSSDIEIDLSGIDGVLEQVDALRNAPELPTSDQAILQTLRLEMSTAEDHSRNRSALKKTNPSLARLLKALASEDKVHFERVLELALRRGISVPPREGNPSGVSGSTC